MIMESILEYVIGLVVLLIIWMCWSLRNVVSIKDYFSTHEGKGILKGIVMALAFAVVVGAVGLLTGCSGTYMNEASVYAGLDYTKNTSSVCHFYGEDNRSTSNLGAKVNLYQSADDRFKTNLKYTHHSCAFGVDRGVYDALGGELEYKFWSR